MQYRKFWSPVGWLYGLGIWLQNWLYDLNLRKIHLMNIPNISIGNLASNLSANFPVIDYIVQFLAQDGKKIALISQSNHSTAAAMTIVSDGRTIYGSAQDVEADLYRIAKTYPSTVIVVGKDLNQIGAFVANRFHPNVIIINNGFSTRSIHRDLDIVVTGGGVLSLKQSMVPAGHRRELISSFRRSHMVFHFPASTMSAGVSNKIRKYTTAPSVGLDYQPLELISFLSDERISLPECTGKTALVFCSMTNPNYFIEIVKRVGIQVSNFLIYPNDHIYAQFDLQNIQQKFESYNSQMMVTTEADALRLQSFCQTDSFPFKSCYFLKMTVNITIGQGSLNYLFKEKIEQKMGK
jgi:tetraacyldisaccharide 4'-kinase